MRFKKFVATACAAAMVIAPMATPVLADDQDTLAGGSGTAEGTTTYIETTQYKITLPTISSMSFSLDPEGLVGYFADSANSSKTFVADTDLATYAGKVVPTGVSKATNLSSVPIELTLDLYLENVGSTTLVSESADVTDDGNELLLTVGAAPYDSTSTKDTDYLSTLADTKVAITGTSQSDSSKISFALANADYEFTKDATSGDYAYALKTGYSAKAANIAIFGITGQLSKDGDWSELAGATDKLTLNVVYSFTALKEIGTGAVNGNNVVVDADALTYVVTGLTDGDTLTSALGSTTDTLTVVLPDGATAISAVTAVCNGKTFNVASTITDNTVTLGGTYAEVMLGVAGSYPMTVTFDDGSKYSITWVVE